MSSPYSLFSIEEEGENGWSADEDTKEFDNVELTNVGLRLFTRLDFNVTSTTDEGREVASLLSRSVSDSAPKFTFNVRVCLNLLSEPYK